MQSECALKAGTTLQGGKYRIESVLGQNDFCISYLAQQAGHYGQVVIKEFFMQEYCFRFESGEVDMQGLPYAELCWVLGLRRKFLEIARVLVSIGNNWIVRMNNFFEENGTVYNVRGYIKGQTLESLIDERGPLKDEIVIRYITKILDAQDSLHSKGVYLWDIRPSKIIVSSHPFDDLLLIDYGVLGLYGQSFHTYVSCFPRKMDNLPRGLYSPHVEHANEWETEVYILGATLRAMVTGAVAEYDSSGRKCFCVVPLRWKKIIDACMSIYGEKRPKSTKNVRKLLVDVVKLNESDKEKVQELMERRLFCTVFVLLGLLMIVGKFVVLISSHFLISYLVGYIAIVPFLQYDAKRDVKKCRVGITNLKTKEGIIRVVSDMFLYGLLGSSFVLIFVCIFAGIVRCCLG